MSMRLPSTSTAALLSYCNDFSNSLSTLKDLQKLHARILRCGASSQHLLPLASELITSACLSGGPSMDRARLVFDLMRLRDPSCWNALIRGYAVFGPCREAVLLYRDMNASGLSPDESTFPFVIRACAVTAGFVEGREVHCRLVKIGVCDDFYVQTALVTMYSQNGAVSEAEQVFELMLVRNVVSWTAMVAGFAQNGLHSEALRVFKLMASSGVQPNSITVTSVLPSCARSHSWTAGGSAHAYAIKQGLDSHVNLVNALISFYANCRDVRSSKALFDGMTLKNLSSWNSMISAYEQNGLTRQVFELFRHMQNVQVRMNHITMASIISVCARLGDLSTARWIHDVVRIQGLASSESVGNALLDMYAKCGSIEMSRNMFDKLPHRSVISWTAIIGAYAKLGLGVDALQLFDQMIAEEVKPNGSTFAVVLSACGHAGLVEEGLKHFDSMTKLYIVTPNVEHCTCLVDLLGRAGRLEEALEIIRCMTIKPDAGVWVALMSACRAQGGLEIAKIAAKQLLHLDPQNLTCYVLMANIYAEAGRWKNAEKVRKLMKQQDLERDPGRSILDVA